ncbi:U3 snoRNP protein [Sporothrix epigloea]|uniref:U3 small nucleolar RNA-associated protein 22 n=1 Tax=Sporothrix epigloea TaxID=1892477 RepID=A0ABP0DCS9_9PEZI
MESNPAKRRKTGHSAGSEPYATLPFDAAAASAGLFRPSTFILETAELLEQSRVDYAKLLPDSEELLRNVKTAVESVETHGPVLISKASAAFEKKNSIKIPYPTPRFDDNSLLKVSMEPPPHCNVVGSYVLKTMIRSQREFAVDMIVEMPKSLFQEKDYLNLRYFYKRAYYLAHLAKAVSKSAVLADAVTDVTFAYLGDNPLQPILVITPKISGTAASTGKSKSKSTFDCKIRIIPCCPDGLFPAAKLLANKNCLRPEASSSTTVDSKVDNEIQPLPPTPFYNATLKAEAAYVPYLKLLHQAQKSCSAFVDACLLGRVWLQQRGFGSSLARGGFGLFEFAALVALLLQTGSKKRAAASLAGNKRATSILSPSLSSTQIFKAVVQFLASTDFRHKPCIIGGPVPESGIDTLKEGTPVLFDAGSRQLNIAYKMSAWSAGVLRQHAKRTQQLLKDDSVIDQFRPTFIARADIALEAYDMVVRVRCPPAATALTRSKGESVSRRGTVWDFGDDVFQAIKRAMGDRASLVHVQLPSSSTWAIGTPLPEIASKSPTHIILGIAFEAANMSRHIDHGPPAEDKKEARKFREFWGDRAELRRFKDGSILETLVWTAGQSASSLCEEITRYILGHRLGLTATDAIEVLSGSDAAGGFSSLVPLTPVVDSAAFTLAREAFATLEADIRALEDLPLHVRQLAPIDAALRSATIAPPAVQSPKVALHPMEVVLYFEASGKWPDNLAAIQRAKVAFLLRIGESLSAAKASKGDTGGIETYIGLENSSSGSEASRNGIINLAYLDIIYRESAAFRLRIHSDLEEAILSRQIQDKTLDQHTRTTSANLLAATRRMFIMLPLHNQTITTYCTRFPALSPTIRLVKRWFSAHKLTVHVSAEFIELVVLQVFLKPHPWQTPASPAPGLLRVLQFLARWDWRTEPLTVDTSGMAPLLPEEEEAAAAAKAVDPRTRLEAWRKIDPNMNHTVLFVSATHETSGTAFTTDTSSGGLSRPQPSKVVASRMTSLARAACRLVKEKDVSGHLFAPLSTGDDADFDPTALFQPSLCDFDVLIHLSPRVIKRLIKGEIADNSNGEAANKSRRSVYKNLDTRTGRELHALPAHPVQLLLDQLNQVYGGGGSAGPIVFFYGAPQDESRDGGSVIAALWNPQVYPRTFRINVPCSFRPVAHTLADKKKNGKAPTSDDEAGDAGPLIEVNRDGILAEIARIGGTLIDHIEIVKKA